MTYSATATITVQALRSKVWDALTKPEWVKQYFFGTTLVTHWKVGSDIVFRGEWDGKAYEDKGTVLTFEPMTHLSYNYWSNFCGHEDLPHLRQIITYHLEETPQGIQVRIDQTNIESQEKAEHSKNNWNTVLAGLKKVVEM